MDTPNRPTTGSALPVSLPALSSRLKYQAHELFLKMNKKYTPANKHWRVNRAMFIKAHFGTASTKLSIEELKQLLAYQTAYITSEQGFCCEAHNRYTRQMRSARNRGHKTAWYQAMKQSIKDGTAVCAECGSKEKLTVDHILPVAKGGKTTQDNCRIMCLDCNMKKGDKIPEGMVAIPFKTNEQHEPYVRRRVR